MARTVDDVLSRRSRSLLIEARAAGEAADEVARVMAAELGRDESWIESQVKAFTEICDAYQLPSSR
jgi:glycerol-3-phosphate dehydrogenase